MSFPVGISVFRSREELEVYVEAGLNETGNIPELGVVDTDGDHWFCFRSAPGGDGYAFEFLLLDPDTGQVHICKGEETGCSSSQCSLLKLGMSADDYGPPFPVIAFTKKGTR